MLPKPPTRVGNIKDYQDMAYPRPVPVRAIHWPEPQHMQNQVQQLRINAQSTAPQIQALTPKTVSHLRVARVASDAPSHQLSVQFSRNPADKYFQAVNVYLKAGKNQPVLLTSGTHSPIKVSVQKTSAASSIIVQSAGNWGNSPLNASPSRAIRLD